MISLPMLASAGGAPPAPAVFKQVLSLSGTDKITLPNEIIIPAGQAISAYVRVTDTTAPRVLWSGTTIPRCYTYIVNGTINGDNRLVAKVDGFETRVIPDDDEMHKVELTFDKDVYIDRFCLSHANVWSLTGQIQDITMPDGETFGVDDNAATVTGSNGTVMALTGGTWEEWEVTDV